MRTLSSYRFMKALFFTPHEPQSGHLRDIPLMSWNGNSLRVQMLAVGICGTDKELLKGTYGWAPPGESELILGHESLGRVLQAPPESGWKPGDYVVGIVRHPDPVPCSNCAIGEWDMCRNGQYQEHGIKELHGFCREYYDLDPDMAVKVDSSLGELGVLLEPASIVAKAWEHIEEIGARALFQPHVVVITGAGPIGLLAALMARQRNLDVHVLDRVIDRPKVDAVKALGIKYHSDLSQLSDLQNHIDIVVECTGADSLVLEMMEYGGPNSVICLAGVSSGGRSVKIDLGMLNRELVLENEAVFGSVNANLRHYQKAAQSLKNASPDWLRRLITRRIPLSRWQEAFEPSPNQIKTIIVGET